MPVMDGITATKTILERARNLEQDNSQQDSHYAAEAGPIKSPEATAHPTPPTRPHPRRCPKIVALSASHVGEEEDLGAEAVALFERWLTKPTTSDVMRSMLESVLEKEEEGSSGTAETA